MTDYIGGINSEEDITAECLARELNKQIRRSPNYKARTRRGEKLRPE